MSNSNKEFKNQTTSATPHQIKVLMIMTGSIACYKACGVLSKLVQNHCQVEVVMTESAKKFVGSATIEGLSGRTPVSDLYQAGQIMDHIHLIRWADVVLVAPATANYINKISQGLGEDLASTLFLAHDFKKPFFIAPAMNTSMYLHPVTQKSIKNLREMGCQILETESGVLACGEVGYGRLLEQDAIAAAVLKSTPSSNLSADSLSQAKSHSTASKKILITSGGTEEAIDSVRTLSNFSTGQSGAELSDYFYQMGFAVTLLKAHRAKTPHFQVNVHEYTDTGSLQSQLKKHLSNEFYDLVVHMAAVSDYSIDKVIVEGVETSPSHDLKLSSEHDITLKLKKNPKIISQIKAWSLNKNLKLVGFKLTSLASHNDVEKAVNKVLSSPCDLVVQNDLSDIRKGEKKYRMYTKAGDYQELKGLQSLAAHLSQIVLGGEL